MRDIKMNLKNCLNIDSEDSALDYAFMFSIFIFNICGITLYRGCLGVLWKI